MKTIMVIAAALMSTAAVAQTPSPPAGSPLAPVEAFLAAFNKGDMAGVAAAHASGDVSIMDEVPPHIWRGPKAVSLWLASLAAYDKVHGRAGGAVVLGAPQVVTTAGDKAYAVVPAVYTFTEQGKAMREPSTMTFALARQAGRWKIAGWSWNGTVPQPAD